MQGLQFIPMPGKKAFEYGRVFQVLLEKLATYVNTVSSVWSLLATSFAFFLYHQEI